MVTGTRCATRSAKRGRRRVKRANSAGAAQTGAAGCSCACAWCDGAWVPIRIAVSATAPTPANTSGRRAISTGLRSRRAGIPDRAGNEPGEKLANAIVHPFGRVGVLARVIKVEGAELGPVLHQRKTIEHGH